MLTFGQIGIFYIKDMGFRCVPTIIYGLPCITRLHQKMIEVSSFENIFKLIHVPLRKDYVTQNSYYSQLPIFYFINFFLTKFSVLTL